MTTMLQGADAEEEPAADAVATDATEPEDAPTADAGEATTAGN
ncbi:MAG: hypothetical protein P8X76_03325 [Maritimibacter sp.]